MSNVERQRRFRERNPGYYNRYNARHKVNHQEAAAAWEAAMAQAQAAEEAQAKRATAGPLMLPAPAVIPVLPGINTIEVVPAPAPLPIAQPAAIPDEQKRSLAA